MGYLLVGARFFGVTVGIALLLYFLNSIAIPSVLSSLSITWPATAVSIASYLGVTDALILMVSFVWLRIVVASVFAIARMF